MGTLSNLGLVVSAFGSTERPTVLGEKVLSYLNYRSVLLNGEVAHSLMDRDEAASVYESVAAERQYVCPIPMNKQKNEMRHPNYLTCLVNMITEATLGGYKFSGDPTNLITALSQGEPVAVLSRRLDGAYPSTVDARAIWEIKEYYDNKSFGSRIADGVYETLLDGYELQELRKKHGINIQHYLIIDSYQTWWHGGGIPYLCRLVDAMHMGLVDEVIVGRQVIARWPEIVRSWLQ